MKRQLAWDEAEEIAFECEPGTITEGKLEILKEMGVTRLSLGIENFNEEILRRTAALTAPRRSTGPTSSRARSAFRKSISI